MAERSGGGGGGSRSNLLFLTSQSIRRFREESGERSMNTLGRILIVEDDPNDVELTLTALADYNLANEVVVTRDGQQALDYLCCRGEFSMRSPGNPAVMLLDLKLPKV